MRHHDKNRKFGRVKSQREALLASLAKGLLLHGRIRTTEARAKEIRPYVERLITKTRSTKTPHVASTRNGGYTRIIKTSSRKSDGSKMAYIEIIDAK
ncbi:MAG TPA: L17 family ribosomal protein [Candidatus Paceibacterota bacterium]